MKIDQRKIKGAIHETEVEIRKHKKTRSLPPGGWPGGAELVARDFATKLYSIQAHRRGKIHLTQKFKTLEEQDVFIGDARLDFQFQVQAA